MGNRSRRELEAQAILRDMLAHPPREPVLPRCELCGAPAAIGAYLWRGVYHFCDAHRSEANRMFEK